MVTTWKPRGAVTYIGPMQPLFWRHARGVSTPSSLAVVSPHAAYKNTVVTVTVAGTGTAWTSGTTFSVTGVSGCSAASPVVNVGAQTATFALTTGSTAGTLTIHDSADSNTATLPVLAAPVGGGYGALVELRLGLGL